MMQNDTCLGGPHGSFPTTAWSEIRRQDWDRVMLGYWKPVFVYIRATWNKSVEDAKDLTQAFFTYFLQKDYLARMHPERGSFRSYLRMTLKHFLIDAARHEAARTPSTRLVALEGTFEELDRIGLAAAGESPEDLFDRQWFETVFSEAVKELRARLVAAGKERYFEAFRQYCLAEKSDEGATYDGVAARLGLKESDVRNYLTHCRRALRDLLRARVREYVSSDDEADEELRAILQR